MTRIDFGVGVVECRDFRNSLAAAIFLFDLSLFIATLVGVARGAETRGA